MLLHRLADLMFLFPVFIVSAAAPPAIDIIPVNANLTAQIVDVVVDANIDLVLLPECLYISSPESNPQINNE